MIELNEKFKTALFLMENTDSNVFIHGPAGTGKSTLIKYFRQHTKKNVAVIAPTGVAAINAGGMTLHKFCRFRPDITLDNVYRMKGWDPQYQVLKNLDTIILDEASMVRADLFDCFEKFVRLNGKRRYAPFGGIQIILVGDLLQLPPVVKANEMEIFEDGFYNSPYLFSSHSFEKGNFHNVIFSKIYRQNDKTFIDILNSIRLNQVKDDDLEFLNNRHKPDFNYNPDDMRIFITMTRAKARDVNISQLKKVKGEPKLFTGESFGAFEQNAFPTDKDLVLKVGAQIMLLNNDPEQLWVNGTLGKVTGFKKKSVNAFKSEILPEVQLENGYCGVIEKYTWNMYKLKFDEEKNTLISEAVGEYRQFPMKLAYASTAHKAMGLTFDKIVVSLESGSFANGQLYCCLSRCRTLEGIILERPIRKSDILVDDRIIEFLKNIKN